MDDGRTAGRRALPEPDDVLARLGITGEAAASTGRAARRRAAERDAGPGPSGRHASPGTEPDERSGRHGVPDAVAQARAGRPAGSHRSADDPGTGHDVAGSRFRHPGPDGTGRGAPPADGSGRNRPGYGASPAGGPDPGRSGFPPQGRGIGSVPPAGHGRGAAPGGHTRSASGTSGQASNGSGRNGVHPVLGAPFPVDPGRNGSTPNGSGRNGSRSGRSGPFPVADPGRHGSTPNGSGPDAAGRTVSPRNGVRPPAGPGHGHPRNGSPATGRDAVDRTPAGPGRPQNGSRIGTPAAPVNGSGARAASTPPAAPHDRTRGSGNGAAETTALIAPKTPTDERPTTTLHLYDEDGEPSGPPPPAEKPGEAARRIDATLTRLTAAHAGLDLAAREDEDDPEDPAPPRQRRKRLVRALVAAAVVVLVLVVGTGWGAQRWLASGIGTVAALDPGSGAIVNAAAQQGSQNVLVVASARADGGATRPASVMVAHVPPDGTSMTLLGIPTDLQVNRPPCARFDGTGYGDQTVPAEARSDLASALDVGGPRCATRVVQQLTGLAVTQYVALDLDAIGAAVDAVSGVSVCVPRPVVDRTLGPIAPTAGTVTLDGREARDFVRATAVEGEQAAGPGPVTRQQQVLAAVLDRVLSGTGLLDLPRVAALRGALGPALSTDGAGLDQVLALADPIGSGRNVTYRPVPTTPVTQGGGTALAAGDAAPLFAALRTGGPLPPPPDLAAPSVADVKVDVLNGSTKTGQAAQVGTLLTGLGFTVDKVGSAPEQAGQTVIRFSPDQAAAADLLAASVPSATTVADPGASGVLQLVLGRSFDSVVKAPTTDPATPATPAAPVACS